MKSESLKFYSVRSRNTGYESDIVSPRVRIQFDEQMNIPHRKDPLMTNPLLVVSDPDRSLVLGSEF